MKSMTEVKAEIKYLRVSPKKLRAVADLIKDLSPKLALDQLKFLGKSGARELTKTLQSALANAENNLKITQDKLRIKTIDVNAGPVLKRFRPVSRGTAHQYKRRTSHIKVILEEVVSGTESKS